MPSASEPVSPALLIDSPGDGIHRVTLNRPARLNAIDAGLAESLLAYFESRRRDHGTRAILLRGAGRAFCAGADIKASSVQDLRLLDDMRLGDWILRDIVRAMRSCPQPIIALVHGAAAGSGLAFALASDVIAAARSAVLHSAFIKLGLSGAELGVAYHLQRAVGRSRAAEMLYAGRPLDAEGALATGLVSAVVDDSALDDYGLTLAQDMLKASSDALRLTKRSLDAASGPSTLDDVMELEERAQLLLMARGAFNVGFPQGSQQ